MSDWKDVITVYTYTYLHILGMHIFCFVDSRNTINLSEKQKLRLSCAYISSGFSPSNSVDCVFLASDFLSIMNSYSTLSFVFMMLCIWTEPLVPSLLMALLKGVYPSPGSFLTIFLVTSTSLLPTQMCGFPWGCLRLLFLTLRCMCLFSLCMFFGVCFSWHLSPLFSFLLSMVCITLVLHIFGLFILLELVISTSPLEEVFPSI